MDDLNDNTRRQREQKERMDNSVDLDALFRQNLPILVNDNQEDVEREARVMWAA